MGGKGIKMADETKEEIKKEEPVEPEKKEEEKIEEKPVEEVKPEEKPAEEPKPEVKPEPAKVEAKPDLSTEASAKVEPSGKFKELIKQIEGLTTLELSELVKALEERFGVSAAAPMAMAAGAPAAAEAEVEEKSNYTVVLADSGAQKIAVIKALREIKQDLGLKEAKDIADAPPKEILKDVPKEEAENAKKKLEAAGAKVELK